MYAYAIVALLLLMTAVCIGQSVGDDITVSIFPQNAVITRNSNANITVRAHIVGIPSGVQIKLFAADMTMFRDFGRTDLIAIVEQGRGQYDYTFFGILTPNSACALGEKSLSWKFIRLDRGVAFGPLVKANLTVVERQ